MLEQVVCTEMALVSKRNLDGSSNLNCRCCDATHGSLALKAYQQNLYLEYYY